ncbi:MAG TPA: DUF4214 domain-containing protein [Paucimonas sp.]|nr:DUF4214 domain-containing protein [Paucimonas sp.]
MSIRNIRAVFLGLAMLLAGCGGEPAGQPGQGKTSLLTSTTVSPASAYNDAVQQLYIAYFGRPADTGGLSNFSTALSQTGVGTSIAQISAAYDGNTAVKALVDAFGTSTESQNLYGTGDTSSFVTAIFNNVLGRAPAESGRQFWVNAIDNNGLTRGNAALSIMAGALSNGTAQGLIDAQLVANKTAVATRFTASITTSAQIDGYKGSSAAATARTMLATVTSTTDPAAMQTTIDSTIATLVANAAPSFATVQTIINQRCLPCHSATRSFLGHSSAGGVRFDTEAEIRGWASSIYSAAVADQSMPFGNATGMTDSERTTIGSWFNAGTP